MFVYTDHERCRRITTEVMMMMMMPMECSMKFDRDPDDRQTLSSNRAMIHSDWLQREETIGDAQETVRLSAFLSRLLMPG